jgi:hypothetical protein
VNGSHVVFLNDESRSLLALKCGGKPSVASGCPGVRGNLGRVIPGKSECRNPKSESNPNDECPNDEKLRAFSFDIRHSGLIRVSGFDIHRVSALIT